MNNNKLDNLLISLILVTILVGILFTTVVCAQEKEFIVVKTPAIIVTIYKPSGTNPEEFEVVLDDFSFHLSSAERQLDHLGINFYSAEKQRVSFKFLNKTDSIDLAKEDAIVGYVFISSTGEVLKRFHVFSDIEIIEIATKHFGLEETKKKGKGDR